MSLINRMLNDLDARHAGERPSLPNEIRPLPAARRPAFSRAAVAGGFVLIVVIAVGALALRAPSTATTPAKDAAPSLAVATPATPSAAPVAVEPSAPPSALAPVHAPPVEPSAVRSTRADSAMPSRRTEPALPVAGEREVPLRVASRLSMAAETSPTPSAMPNEKVRPGSASAADGAPSGTVARQERSDAPRERAERLYRAALAAIGDGRAGDAGDALRRALADDPAHVPARQLLIKLLIEARALDAAHSVLAEGLDRLPAQVPWAVLLSRLQLDRGDAEAALSTLLKVDAHGGGQADFQGAVGAVLHHLGRFAEAEARYAAAGRLEPAAGRWSVGRGLALEAAGRTDAAREAYLAARASGALTGDLQNFVEQKLR